MAAITDETSSLTSPLIVRTLDNPSTNSRVGGRGIFKPKVKTTKEPKLVLFCILLTVVLERLAYYSLLGNLVVYINSVLTWSPSTTVVVTLVFAGFTWISCFIGGYLGDAYFGRFNTICMGLFLYLIGFLCLPFITYVVGNDSSGAVGHQPYIIAWFCLALLLVSLGEGCFKANMSPFGADQLSRCNDEKVQGFFSYFYWAINIGSFIGFGPVIYLEQMDKGFIIGYGTSVGCLLLAVFVFVLPARKRYIVSAPNQNVLIRTFRIIKEARKNKKKVQSQRYKLQRAPEYEGSGCFEDFSPIKHWLDRAMIKYGGSYLDVEVEEVKLLLKTIPVFAFLVIYCVLYFQSNGTFLLQGMHMHVPASKEFTVPVAWLGLFNNITVLIFVPIFDKLIYPGLAKLGIRVPYVTKLMIGMVIASLSMVSAGIVELKRINTNETIVNRISGKSVIGNDLSLWYQIPQFGLLGISEILVLMTGLEFAYCQAPKKMQAIVTGLFFIANGIGSMLGSIILEVASLSKDYFIPPQQMKQRTIENLKGHLYVFFFSLAILNGINVAGFALYCWKCRAKEKTERGHQTVDEFIKNSLDRSSRYNRMLSDET